VTARGDLRHLVDGKLEAVVLGTILQTRESAFREVERLLTADDFAIERHRFIFSAISRVAPQVGPDVETVTHALMDTGKLKTIGGLSGLLEVHCQAIPGIGLAHFARTLRKKSDARRAVRPVGELGCEIEVHGLNGNGPDIIRTAQ
jgi:replicative DNA helicase